MCNMQHHPFVIVALATLDCTLHVPGSTAHQDSSVTALMDQFGVLAGRWAYCRRDTIRDRGQPRNTAKKPMDH